MGMSVRTLSRWLRVLFVLSLLSMPVIACSVGGGGESGNVPPSDAVVVSMLYGSEKEAWIDDVTADFNAQRIESTEGRPIFVEAVPAGSTESMDLILNGQEQPAIWSPASGNSIKVFTIAYGSDASSSRELLEAISEASGAQSYESALGQIEQVYRDIATFF